MGSYISRPASTTGRQSSKRKFPLRSHEIASLPSLAHQAPPVSRLAWPVPTSAAQDGSAGKTSCEDTIKHTTEFATRLRDIGIAQPVSISISRLEAATLRPPSSRDNATLSVLKARQAAQLRANDESGDVGLVQVRGRQFVHLGFILDALQMRSGGTSNSIIEERLGLRTGIMAKLGPRGLFDAAFH
ncbi:hypothetical protein L249_4202 [Ophiocordyceps polyrhachis-furcata BCC 54312]|uniref:Helix-turn-helix domain-containing protein n=1 Tax=Ophiocordyceps polyrhachis-furcata BCC 54312 TaxID=1330021 RepID=A0A367LBU8_9HYPO|nr:hypothetical protein L249_4202 [Ophiocordyceps polyrhachis-furcata BCC 54312]